MKGSPSLVREDGRSFDQMRLLQLEEGLLVQADGSARVALGGTRALAAAFGPAEALVRDELAERATIEVLLSGGEPEAEATLARCVEAACLTNLHPRTAVRVVVQRVTGDGSEFSAWANAACLALMDAGVQLRTVFVGVTCAVMAEDGRMLVDPTKKEEEAARAIVDLVFDRSLEGILVSRCRGRFQSTEEYLKCVDLGASMCGSILSFVRKTTEARFKPQPRDVKEQQQQEQTN